MAQDLVLPGAHVLYMANKFGWAGVVETPKIKPKLHPLVPRDSYTLSYTVEFLEGFQWQLGGKLPGLSGGKDTTGCNVVDSAGWSVRFMWKQEGRAILYLYDQDRTDVCGKVIDLKYNFKIGIPQKITLKVKVNKPETSDGEIHVWFNDSHIKSIRNLRLRGNVPETEAQVDTFMFSTFYGGQSQPWAPLHNTEAIFGDFTISK